ncbi:hypothetical protein LCGC14_1455230 [marine sediment metagenome]|uniref:Uncharacterized protein n=1 Tax=marine sediment metagenome TaxID=412755 RepID=A0A0F9LXA5_9ZZZZ
MIHDMFEDVNVVKLNSAIPSFPIPQYAECPECGGRAFADIDREWLMSAMFEGICTYTHTHITKGPPGFGWAERVRKHVFHTVWNGVAWVPKGEVKITGRNLINETSDKEL